MCVAATNVLIIEVSPDLSAFFFFAMRPQTFPSCSVDP